MENKSSGNGDNWFEDALTKLYDSLFDPTSAIYVPNVILNGYNDDGLGIHVQPRRSVSVSDINGVDVEQALPGGCGLDFTNGDAFFSGRDNVVMNFESVGKGGALAFSQEDSVVQVPLSFTSIVIRGDLIVDQPCEDMNNKDYTRTWTGKYTVMAEPVELTATITLNLGDKLSATVHPLTMNEPHITITGSIDDPPPNLEGWWLELANSPQVIDRIMKSLAEGLTDKRAEQWIESIINPLLAQIPL